MSKQVSSLAIGMSANLAPFTGALTSAIQPVNRFVSQVESAESKLARFESAAAQAEKGGIRGMIGSLGELGAKIAEFTGLAAIAATALEGLFEAGKGIELASTFETASVQLKALTGSGEVAGDMLKDLREFSANTPFAFPELLNTSKRLLAVGISAQSIPKILQEAGDVAAGVGAPISAIGDIFARVALEGHLGSRELLEFGREGIPVMQALEGQFHTTADGVSALAERGQIGFTQLQSAFASMTSGSGRFAGILDAQAKTIGGEWHSLTASLEESSADMAEAIIQGLNLPGVVASVHQGLDWIRAEVATGAKAIEPYWERVKTVAVAAWNTVYAVVAPVVMKLWGVVQTAWGAISGFIEAHSGTIMAAIGGVAAVVASTGIPAVFGAIAGAATFAVGAVASFAGVLATPIVIAASLGGALAALANHFGWIDKIEQASSQVFALVENNWRGIVNTVVSYGVALEGVVAAVFGAVWDIAKPIWTAVANVAVWAWDTVTGSSLAAGVSITGVLTGIGSAAKSFVDTITNVMNITAFAISNAGTIFKLFGVGATYELVKFGNQVQYTFTDVVPGIIVWFGNNWRQIFTDILNFTGTVFRNMTTNIAAVMMSLKDIIAGRTSFKELWTPLTDGFQATLTEMPAIADRQVGAVEKSLGDKADAIGKTLGQNLADQMAMKKAQADAITDSIVKPIQNGMAKAKFELPGTEKTKEVKFDAAIVPPNLPLTITPEIKRSKAMITGSAESQAARYLEPLVQSTPTAPPPAVGAMVAPAAGMQAAPTVTPATSMPAVQPAAADNVRTLSGYRPQDISPPAASTQPVKTAPERYGLTALAQLNDFNAGDGNKTISTGFGGISATVTPDMAANLRNAYQNRYGGLKASQLDATAAAERAATRQAATPAAQPMEPATAVAQPPKTAPPRYGLTALAQLTDYQTGDGNKSISTGFGGMSAVVPADIAANLRNAFGRRYGNMRPAEMDATASAERQAHHITPDNQAVAMQPVAPPVTPQPTRAAVIQHDRYRQAAQQRGPVALAEFDTNYARQHHTAQPTQSPAAIASTREHDQYRAAAQRRGPQALAEFDANYARSHPAIAQPNVQPAAPAVANAAQPAVAQPAVAQPAATTAQVAAAPQPAPAPPVPATPAADDGKAQSAVQAAMLQKIADLARQQTDYLGRIETNTRTSTLNVVNML